MTSIFTNNNVFLFHLNQWARVVCAMLPPWRPLADKFTRHRPNTKIDRDINLHKRIYLDLPLLIVVVLRSVFELNINVIGPSLVFV